MASPIRLRAAADMCRFLPLVGADVVVPFGLPGLPRPLVPPRALIASVRRSRCASNSAMIDAVFKGV
jgi:hypothetical protein